MYTYTNPLFIYDNKKRKPSNSQNGQIFLVSYPRFWMIDRFWLLLPQSPHFSMSDPKTCAEGPSLFLKFDYSGFWHFCIFRIYMVTVLLWVVCECVLCARFYYFETWKRFFLVLAFKLPLFFLNDFWSRSQPWHLFQKRPDLTNTRPEAAEEMLTSALSTALTWDIWTDSR